MPGFKKIERLCSRKAIELLFEKGKSKTAFPLKLIYRSSEFESPYPVQAMFVVPKKKFKRANKRNILKRRMREAYRLSKESMYAALSDKKLELAFIYLHHEAHEYVQIEKSMQQLLTYLVDQNGTSGSGKPE
jgi:ribonuclease P protein component